MSWIVIVALILSGILVGFINTLAGGGTIISLSLLMFLGLPANIANGTYRIAATVQTIVAVGSFRKQKILDFKKGLVLGIPTVIGALLGAYIAIDLNAKVIEKAIAFAMLLMLFFIIYKPQKWLKGQQDLIEKKVSLFQYAIFFIIGVYGGFIHAGVGYLLLAGVVLSAGYDLVSANAIKNLIVLMYTPFTLVIFMISGCVNYEYGLIHSIGNILGAYIASKYAVTWGANFVRWVIVSVIILTTAQIFGLVNIKDFFYLALK